MRRGLLAVLFAGAFAVSATTVHAAPILTTGSSGYYNANLGQILDGSLGFPCANSACGDPTVNPNAPPPDLSAGAAILGNWLGNPGALNANWTGLQPIPATWAVNTETAIVYEFTLAQQSQLIASFGVDNGLYVWVDGVYMFGAMAPGGAFLGEYPNVNLGVLGPGTHYLQVMREDHGGATGFAMNVDATAVPEPAMLLLLLGGASASAVRAARRRQRS
jgi:hypothetical protein